jgi:hypothetical protein
MPCQRRPRDARSFRHEGEGKAEIIDLKGLLARDEDFVRASIEAVMRAALEAEMTETIDAAKGERDAVAVPQRVLHLVAGDATCALDMREFLEWKPRTRSTLDAAGARAQDRGPTHAMMGTSS